MCCIFTEILHIYWDIAYLLECYIFTGAFHPLYIKFQEALIMNFKIGLIGNEKIVEGFEIAGLSKKDKTVFLFESDCDIEALKTAFLSLSRSIDIGLIFITEPLYEMLKSEIENHDGRLPAILSIPSRL